MICIKDFNVVLVIQMILQQSEAEFFAKLEADLVLAKTYEDASNQQAALKCIPRAELDKHQ